MSKFDPGTKRTCPECGAKFYDLNKRPAVCPKCAHSYNPDAGVKSPKKPDPKAAPPREVKETVEDEETPEAEAEDDIEGLNAEEEEAEALALDGDKPAILPTGDDDEDADPADAGAALPEGFTEAGVEDDSDILADDDEEIDLDEDLEED